jgi:tRNA(Ile)-lysidine synthase
MGLHGFGGGHSMWRMSIESRIPWLGNASRGTRWLAGISGGADSVAMLHLLHRNGFRKVVVCHLNHRLRGRASAADARFVAKLADRLGYPCESAAVDVRSRMQEQGESMETAARHARHGFFSECAAKFRCRRILLAHHADDQAETVLWNLLRGSHGLRGMRGEQEIRVAGKPLRIIRPLLGVRRAELAQWLHGHSLDWREDASNREAVAVRNRLRNEVFPLLAEITGRDPVAAFVRGAQDTAQREAFESALLDEAKVEDPQGRLHLPALRKLPALLARLAVRRYLSARGIADIDRSLLEKAVSLLDPHGPPSINLPGGGRLRRRAGRIWVEVL